MNQTGIIHTRRKLLGEVNVIWQNFPPASKAMMQSSSRKSSNPLLEILENVLPKTTEDAELAKKILKAVEKVLLAKEREKDFQKFCRKTPVPNLQEKTIKDLEKIMTDGFKDSTVIVQPMAADEVMAVEVQLPDGSDYYGEMKVDPAAPELDDPDAEEYKVKFVAFPVALPGDPENVWLMAKREDLSNDEAGRAIEKLQAEFWESKPGQKSLREGADRTFPEFMERVPAAMLREEGLKRHYKLPEAVAVLREGLK
ncbi:MAG: hypothetical protein ACPGVU_20750 [Limisphaerales bacterium]